VIERASRPECTIAHQRRACRRSGSPRPLLRSACPIRVWDGISDAGDWRAKRDVKIVRCFRRAKLIHLASEHNGSAIPPKSGRRRSAEMGQKADVRSTYSITSSARNESGTGMPRAWRRNSEGELALARPVNAGLQRLMPRLNSHLAPPFWCYTCLRLT